MAEDRKPKILALVNDDAAIMIRDEDAAQKLMTTAFDLLHNPDRLAQLGAQCPQTRMPTCDSRYRG